MTEKRILVVSLGLDRDQLEALAIVLGERCDHRQATLTEPLAQIEKHLREADIALIQWDGTGKPGHQLLQRLSPVPDKAYKARIYAATRTGRKSAPLPPRQAKPLGILGWIDLPARYFEVQRMIHDLAPTAEVDHNEIEAELAKMKKRRLALTPDFGPSLNDTADLVIQVWTKAKNPPPEPAPSPGQVERPTILKHATWFHPDPDFAAGLIKPLKDAGVKRVDPTTTIDDVFVAIRGRASEGIILWYDVSDTQGGVLLDQITEARDLPLTPILVLIPGQAALAHLISYYGETFFDAVATTDRKRDSLEAAITRMVSGSKDPASPRAILGALRHQATTLAEAEALTAKLGAKPGRAYWAIAELIPFQIKEGKTTAAVRAAEKLIAMKPKAFTTLLLRHQAAFAAGDKRTAAMSLAKEALAFPDLTAERLSRVGTQLVQWRAADALADLLDGWWNNENLSRDVAMTYLAYKYHRLIDTPKTSRALLTAAMSRDPFRLDYLLDFSATLSAAKEHDRAAAVCRIVAETFPANPAPMLGLVRALVEGRRMREARTELQKLLEFAPGLKEALELESKLQ